MRGEASGRIRVFLKIPENIIKKLGRLAANNRLKFSRRKPFPGGCCLSLENREEVI
jgi:hypothetical protein